MLGGQATCRQVSQKAKELYPDITLYVYVGIRLKRLARWGIVKYFHDSKNSRASYYKIVDEHYLD
jgi:hypothetical protein